jgi:dTDP-4-dehydrorhamnose 3,5-epimerase
LADNCELIYHHSQIYKPGFEGGIKYDDQMINIQWPGRVTNISTRDEEHNYLAKNFEGIKV